MKILFISIIALVIPLFFMLVFVLSTYNKLAALRNRCREARDRIEAASLAGLPPVPSSLVDATRDYLAAAENYEAASTGFPASLVALVFGFRPVEILPRRD